MSTPSTNWIMGTFPVPVNKGKAVQALTIAAATVGTLAQVHAPHITAPANLFYFKAYGGDSAAAGTVADFDAVDPASSPSYSKTTGKYTAPVTGLYRFASVCYSGAASGTTEAQLRRHHVGETQVLQRVSIKSEDESQSFSVEVFLTVGDEIDLFVQEGRLKLQPYASFTMSSLTVAPRSTFEGRLVYQTA
jgi:hypothetical protein